LIWYFQARRCTDYTIHYHSLISDRRSKCLGCQLFEGTVCSYDDNDECDDKGDDDVDGGDCGGGDQDDDHEYGNENSHDNDAEDDTDDDNDDDDDDDYDRPMPPIYVYFYRPMSFGGIKKMMLITFW